MGAPIRSLLGTICTFLLLTAGAFAQESSPITLPDDRTDSSVLRERAQTAGQQPQDTRGAQQSDPRARLEWRLQERGTPSVAFKQHLLQLWQGRAARRDLPDAALAGTSGPQWVPIGPTGADYEQNGTGTGFVRDSGRARTILPHPTDPNTVYFLTSGGGLWVTNNFTASQSTWRPLTDSLITTSGGSVAFGRTPNVLYLGLGDPFDVVNLGGVMEKSLDGGATWTGPVDLGFPFSVRDVKVDTSGAQDIVLVATDQGLFRSTDGGVSYAPASGPDLTFQIMGFWSLVQTSAGWLTSAKQCPIAVAICASLGTIYISTDHGANWAPITNSGNVYTGAGRTTLAVGVPGDNIVYAFAENSASFDQLDLFRSTNGGQDWTALNINFKAPTNPNIDNTNMDLMQSQSGYNQMMLVDPSDPARNTVYLGGRLSSAKSIDGGNTWTLLTNWFFGAFGLPYAHADFHSAAISHDGTLMFGSDGGLFVSTDSGTTWSSDKNNGLQTFLFYSLTSTPGFPDSVMGGTQDNGTRVRKGNTMIYNQVLGGDGLGAGWSQANTNTAMATLEGNSYGFNLTNQIPDVNENFLRSVPPLINDSVFFTPVATPTPAADPTGKAFFTASNLQVYKTVDGGLTWTVIGSIGATSNNIPAPTRITLRSSPHAVGVSPTDLPHVGVIGSGGHVEFTTNGGNTWTDSSVIAQVPKFLNTSSFTWADNRTMYVTSITPQVGGPRIVKSGDGGATWIRADGNLPDVPISQVLVDPRDSTHNSLFAATDAGVFQSTNGGVSWAQYGAGLPNTSVSDIYMPPDGSFLRIATDGRGLWELPFLSFAGATLADDVATCDSDGSLDNGESGHLTITLHNDGNTALNGITARITSTNPHLTFPNGNVVNFPAAAAGADTTTAIILKLGGATGIQQLDFSVAFTDPSLGIPSPVTAIASFRANFDEIPNGSAGDNIEGTSSPWTVTGTPAFAPDIETWQRRQISPVEHRWVAVDSNAATDVSLVSPILQVGSGNFTVSFEQRYVFESRSGSSPSWFDGMVIEASSDGGATWIDIGANASPGYDQILATGGGNVLEGRLAYAGASASYPNFTLVTLGLGTQFAGRSVQIRFRVGTDINAGRPGVELRNITTTGLTNTPFTSVVPASGVCLSSTNLTSSKNPSSFGDLVTFGATVTSGLTVASGAITYKDAGTSIGTGILNGVGQSTLSTATLSVGTHPIAATYGGDSTHAPSASSILQQTVIQATTTTTVISSLNPAVVGLAVTFTATVNSTGGKPTGSATFFDGTAQLGTGTLNAQGAATFTTATLTPGSHSITAQYPGDSNFTKSASAALTEAVKGATTTAVTTSLSPSLFGQGVTFTATVTTMGVGTPTGIVGFLDGATQIGTGALDAQRMTTFSTSALAGGSNSITATYAGDANFGASTSSPVMQAVSVPDFTMEASPASQMITAGQPGTISLTVTASNSAMQTFTFACGTLPPRTTCSFLPPTITVSGTNSGSSTATIQTMANSALPFSPPSSRRSPGLRIGLLAWIWALAIAFFAWLWRRVPRRVAFTCVLLCGLALSLASCSSSGSGSGPSGTTPGTYSISVTASSGGTTHSATVSVVVH